MTNKRSDTDYADRVVREAMLAATGGLNPDRSQAPCPTSSRRSHGWLRS
jgi:hypothetical protein